MELYLHSCTYLNGVVLSELITDNLGYPRLTALVHKRISRRCVGDTLEPSFCTNVCSSASWKTGDTRKLCGNVETAPFKSVVH
jgi:hypothetical protein